MKKLLTVMLALVLSVSAAGFAACGKDEGGKFTFYAPDGAPALAIAKFIKENENFGEEYEFSYSVVSSDKIGGIMQKGTGDFIIMPVNAASKLYKAEADNPYKMVSVLTHGNLYIMSKSDSTLESLKGKVVGVIGQGLVPDLTFKYVLEKAGIEYVVSDSAENGKVALRYFASASDLIPMLKQGKLTTGLLPEPAATKLASMESSYSVRIDLQSAYDAEKQAYPQAVLMVKSSVLEKNPNLADKIENAFKDVRHWLYENYLQAAEAVAGALEEGVTPSLTEDNLNADVIDNCKIYWQSATDAKNDVTAYINAIREIGETAANAVTDEFFAK